MFHVLWQEADANKREEFYTERGIRKIDKTPDACHGRDVPVFGPNAERLMVTGGMAGIPGIFSQTERKGEK